MIDQEFNKLAKKYPGWSPYNYTLDSPATLLDTDGRRVTGYTFGYAKGGDVFGGGLSASFVTDSQGKAGILVTGYGGLAAGEFGSVVGGFVYNSMTSIKQLNGLGANASFGLGLGFVGLNVDLSMSFSFPPHIPTVAISGAPGMEGGVAFGGLSFSHVFETKLMTSIVKKYGTGIRVQYQKGSISVSNSKGKVLDSFKFQPQRLIDSFLKPKKEPQH